MVIAGLPNTYGAVVRKTVLRLAGCVAGGLAALAAMIIVSQNFDTLPAYLVAIFAVTMFSTYVAQSDEWLGYAGIQTGVTFMICYVGPAPSSDIYGPLWRFWGIVGVLTTGFIFLFLWPEYASDKLVESLDKLLRTAIDFGKEVAAGRITEERIAAEQRRFSANCLQVLNMGDQARLRGTARRYRLRGRDRCCDYHHTNCVSIRNHRSRAALGCGAMLPDEVLECRTALEERFYAAFQSLLERLKPVTFDQPVPLSPLAPPQLPINDLKNLIEELVAKGMREVRDLPPEVEAGFFAQVESYRRLVILLSRLDADCSKIAAY